jgi:tryptophan-rich sensory protein
MMTGMTERLLPLLAWIFGTFLASLGAVVTADAAARFYTRLNRPSWAPPAWLFGPAWSLLYVLMAVAAFRVWEQGGWAGARVELSLYVVQLVLNAGWSWFFFVKRTGLGSTIEAAMLWAAVTATGVAFGARDAIAGWLFVPYVAWVTFATALTISVWRRNPELLAGQGATD